MHSCRTVVFREALDCQLRDEVEGGVGKRRRRSLFRADLKMAKLRHQQKASLVIDKDIAINRDTSEKTTNK